MKQRVSHNSFRKENNCRVPVALYKCTCHLFCYSLYSVMKGLSSKPPSSCCFTQCCAHLSQFSVESHCETGSHPLWTKAKVTTLSTIILTGSVAINKYNIFPHTLTHCTHTWSSLPPHLLSADGRVTRTSSSDISNQHFAAQLAYVSALA